jgi:hypothetical protein
MNTRRCFKIGSTMAAEIGEALLDASEAVNERNKRHTVVLSKNNNAAISIAGDANSAEEYGYDVVFEVTPP